MELSLSASPSTLAARHAELDSQIAEETARPHPDNAIVAELKKAKLRIKDALIRTPG
ncbi:MAG: YdcH family protein [Sphingomonadales bacterium]|nr:YdcH family protein [Sphingomonadales bacterium]